MYETITSELTDGVAVLTINRPQSMNALSAKVRVELLAALRAAHGNARVIVMTGAGRAFCSGQDLTDAQALGAVDFEQVLNDEYVPLLTAITEMEKQSQVWQVACPEFVPLIEANCIHDPYTYEIAKSYLAPLIEADIDTLVMGCTHYPHLVEIFRQILPSHVKFIDPAKYVVKAVAQELDILGLGDRTLRKNARPKFYAPTFYVSGDPEQFSDLSSRWLGYQPSVQNVELLPSSYPSFLKVDESSLMDMVEKVELIS
jgi:glutamate racemase